MRGTKSCFNYATIYQDNSIVGTRILNRLVSCDCHQWPDIEPLIYVLSLYSKGIKISIEYYENQAKAQDESQQCSERPEKNKRHKGNVPDIFEIYNRL